MDPVAARLWNWLALTHGPQLGIVRTVSVIMPKIDGWPAPATSLLISRLTPRPDQITWPLLEIAPRPFQHDLGGHRGAGSSSGSAAVGASDEEAAWPAFGIAGTHGPASSPMERLAANLRKLPRSCGEHRSVYFGTGRRSMRLLTCCGRAMLPACSRYSSCLPDRLASGLRPAA